MQSSDDEDTSNLAEQKKQEEQLNETTYTQKINNFLQTNAHEFKILNLGCGNSILPEEMYDIDRYTSITNVDISAVCINMMAERNQELRPSLSCKCKANSTFVQGM